MQEVNVEKLQRLQKQLQRKFDLVYPLDDEKSFFIGIADYVQAIEQSDYLTAIIKTSIIPERIKLDSEINSISEKSIKETKKVFGKLFNLMMGKNIDNPNILAEFNEYHSVLDGTTQFSGELPPMNTTIFAKNGIKSFWNWKRKWHNTTKLTKSSFQPFPRLQT